MRGLKGGGLVGLVARDVCQGFLGRKSGKSFAACSDGFWSLMERGSTLVLVMCFMFSYLLVRFEREEVVHVMRYYSPPHPFRMCIGKFLALSLSALF